MDRLVISSATRKAVRKETMASTSIDDAAASATETAADAMTGDTARMSIDDATPDEAPEAAADKANLSALRENIARRGKNAYYYAHSHKADGPAWDGRPGK